jgi:hypothetical protein
MKTRHEPDRDIIGIELVDSISMHKTLNYMTALASTTTSTENHLHQETGIEKGLSKQAPEPITAQIAGET